MKKNIAALLMTQNDYLAEAKLIINKLNESDIKDHFKQIQTKTVKRGVVRFYTL